MPHIRLISFGYLHQPTGPDGDPVPPAADRVEDVRERLRDPAAAKAIVDLDGRDPRVQDVVLNTPGARELLGNLADHAEALAAPGSIAIGCAGGKHRAAALVELLARLLRERGVREVEIEHRHIHLPRVLKMPDPFGTQTDWISSIYDLDERCREQTEQDRKDPGHSRTRALARLKAASAADLAEFAQLDFAFGFCPRSDALPLILPWRGYRVIDPARSAPHAVAYLGEGLFLTYRRTLLSHLGWSAEFDLIDSSSPTAQPVDYLSDLADALTGVLESYRAWCQDGRDTAAPYEYRGPRNAH